MIFCLNSLLTLNLNNPEGAKRTATLASLLVDKNIKFKEFKLQKRLIIIIQFILSGCLELSGVYVSNNRLAPLKND